MPSGARCHPNSMSGADEGLQGEEQKLRRARARRLIVETNRRRRALEDKQKQRDLREQHLREQVLQLRRRRIQEATERFQKAHLQPRRSRRSVPTIEEALDDIKSNLSAAHRSAVCTSSAQPGPASAAVQHQHQHRLISGDAPPQDPTHVSLPFSPFTWDGWGAM
ncbi:centrosomal protein of 126 kDa-like [Synchiropus picturatus]